ncbi:hypothetical protein [Algoriphagus vanfongensis]|uniref:hypothetical protein n=1 Tax=Algoriphagus vanfongensis TaxID=426371 RepID=UPI00041A5A66|nr:hypothetical protein [Algoriphagus vanfongensis]
MKNQLKSILGLDPKSLLLPALLGAIIPSALLIFLIIANRDSYELWMALPLVIIPIGGAFGGIFFYMMGFHWFPRGNQKLIALIFSCIIYFICLWLFSVLAFSITGHWD